MILIWPGGHWWEGERDRLILWAPVCLGLGVGGYFSLTFEPSWTVLLGLLIFVLMTTAGVSRLRTAPISLVLCGAALLAALGGVIAKGRVAGINAAPLERAHGPVSLVGKIVKLDPYPKGVRLYLERLDVHRLEPFETPKRIRIRLRGAQAEIQPGDWVRLTAKLLPPAPPALPGGFDFQRHAYFQGLGATGFGLGKAVVIKPRASHGKAETEDWSVNEAIERARLAVTKRLLAVMSPETGPIAAALITGHRTLVPEEQLEVFRRAGIAHLLAISGLHIGLIAGLVFVVTRTAMTAAPAIALRLPVKKVAAVVAVLAALSYALLAGLTIPTQRAFLVTAAILSAVLLDRRGISLRLLAVAAFLILFAHPEALLSASFQMSFAAAVALVASYEAWRRRRDDRPPVRERGVLGRIGVYFFGIAMTTVIAGAATAPFVLYHFNQVAGLGNVANLIAVPVTALWVMPMAVAGLMMTPFGLEALPLRAMGEGIEVILATATPISVWPNAVHGGHAVPVWALAGLSLGVLWACLWRKPVLRAAGVGGLLVWGAGYALRPAPDVLVSGKADLVGVRSEQGGYLLSTRRGARFTGEQWQRSNGALTVPVTWASRAPPRSGKEGDAAGPAIRCDGMGCRIRVRTATIAFAKTRAAASEDCWRPDIRMVIATRPVRDICAGGSAIVIDRFDVWREGAHAITIEADGALSIETVRDRRGDRPWTPARPRSRKNLFRVSPPTDAEIQTLISDDQ